MVEEIKEEAAKFNDLVIFNFLDTYRNLTVKTLCSLHFVNVAYDTKYVFKSDDDVFLKLTKILNFASHYRSISSNVVFGKVSSKAQTQRSGKWALSMEEYAEEIIPDYCTGPLYGLTTGAVKALLAANKNIPLFSIEDAAMGLLAQKSGKIKLISVPMWYDDALRRDLKTDLCSSHFATHHVRPASMLQMWRNCGKV